MQPSITSKMDRMLVSVILFLGLLIGATVAEQEPGVEGHHGHHPGASNADILEAASLRVLSDEDQAYMQQIKYHIANEYSEFKTVSDVHSFLDKVKLLVQKHPKNVAFAQGEIKELFKFLSQEIVTRLIRVDTDPFVMPISDERMTLAQRAIDEDELTKKLFGGPLRNWAELRRQQNARQEGGNHKDGNFFTSIWCKLSGNCSNQ